MTLQTCCASLLLVSLTLVPLEGLCQTAIENNPADCSDGKDNDANGKTDCDDPNCAVLKVCKLLGSGTAAETAAVENTSALCQDGIDNDGDGAVDCLDPDCSVLILCSQPPQTPPAQGSIENTPEACKNGMDDDGDGFIDCKDQDCSVFVFCQGGGATAPTNLVLGGQPYVSSGWALGGGIFGFVALAPVIGLVIGSVVTRTETDDAVPTAPLGGAALAVHIIAGPIAGASAISARGVRHNVGCLVTGWVFYGVAIVYFGIMTGASIAVADEGPHPALIGVNGILMAVSLVNLSADALIVWTRARSARASVQTAEHSPGMTFYPALTPVTYGNRTVGMTGGLGMIF